MRTFYLLADATDTGATALGGVLFLLLLLLACVVSTFSWILPGIVASKRKHHNQGAIWAVTLLLGWTFIGWVVALVWAFTNPPPQQQVIINNDPKRLIS